ncbi:MAG TPA: signal peptidase I [Jatrophihabitantaceae bacterium]|nr:signal peptidase I [Jatrophihabitantaceae bacterium]
MSDSDDLRSRIEAQIAARRQAGRHGRGRDPIPHRTPPELPDPAPPPTLPAPPPRPVSPLDETQIIEAIPPDDRGEIPRRSHRRRPPTRQFGFPIRLLVLVVVAALLALGLRTFVVEPFWIPSESMEPTLHGCAGCNNDRLLVDKLSYRLHAVHRGDVVVFHRPPGVDAPENVLIKRVIGLPGETVSGHDGKVWIGSRSLEESYVNPACHGTTDFAAVTVPSGRYFMMGDNRCNSSDSRVFGPIPKSSIIGRAFLIIWPVGRIHWL